MTDDPRNPEPVFNPYAAPGVAEQTSHPDGGLTDLRPHWIGAVVINLPVPVMFGFHVTERSNTEIGMLFGVAFWCVAGIVFLRRHREIMRCVMVGSVAVALSQFIGVAQIMCGMLALNASKAVLEPNQPGDQIHWLPTAISTTILTGLGLILCAFFIGAVLVAIYDKFNVPNRPPRR